MNADEAFAIVEMICGYWPTPAMEAEEVKAFITELAVAGRTTYDEARSVVRAEAGRQWRPRPELIDLVWQYRRQEALRNPLRALDDGGQLCAPEENLEELSKVRCS